MYKTMIVLIAVISLIASSVFLAWAIDFASFKYSVDVPDINPTDYPQMYDAQDVGTSAATSTPLVNHIVTVDGATFLKLFTYANSHGITVGETIPILLNNGSQVAFQGVFWRPEDITADKVSVNIIERTSTNPNTYITVKNLAQDIPNDGSFSWSDTTKTPNSFIEIECGSTTQGCHASILIPLN